MKEKVDELKVGDLVSCLHVNGLIGQVIDISEDNYAIIELTAPIRRVGDNIKFFKKII